MNKKIRDANVWKLRKEFAVVVLRDTSYASLACNIWSVTTAGRQNTLCAGQATPKASHCGGQAMIEFTIALVAILAVIAGTLLLNKMEWTHTRTMTAARATAGALALDIVYQGALDAKFISDWDPGADKVRYTHDDEAILDGTAISLVDNIIANAGLDAVSPLPPNAITRLQTSPTPLNEFYLVKGGENMAVDLTAIPAVRHLISGEPSITVESEAWLTWTEGIY